MAPLFPVWPGVTSFCGFSTKPGHLGINGFLILMPEHMAGIPGLSQLQHFLSSFVTVLEKLSPEGIENIKDRLEALTEINRVYISEGIREEKVGYEEGKER